MLRTEPYRYHRPANLAQAMDLLGSLSGPTMLIAGGTDLVPNLKHRLFSPEHLVSLRGVVELRGITVENGSLSIGAGETLSDVAGHPLILEHAPSLAEAARHVAGPQLRNSGTLGGNVCLDTRCTYYNQTHFWRKSLGFCLKKDGDVCHVTRVGKKCVAAHSADTPPVLITLEATLELVRPQGTRTMSVEEFFLADGILNTRRGPDEVLTRISIPINPQRRGGYAKLRQRGAIDFPLLTVAVSATTGQDGVIGDVIGVVTALGSRPRTLTGWQDLAVGERWSPELVEALVERAHQQCRPLENIIVDPEWRRAMVPVYVRRALAGVGAHSSGALNSG